MDSPEKSQGLPQSEDYGVEVLCASWNPVASAVVEPLRPACRERIGDPFTADVETFLKEFYRYQR